MKKVTIVLVDDHRVVCEGFKLLIDREKEFSVIGEARTGKEAISLMRSLQPDLVLMDISMPDMNGLQAANQIILQHPKTKIIILSSFDNETFVQNAIQIGVHGYLLKVNASEDIIRAIREVGLRGNKYFSPEIQTMYTSIVRRLSRGEVYPLTSRELEILQCIAEGRTNKTIADELNVSVKTVDAHRTQLMKKLDIHDIAALVRYAIRLGLINP